MDKHLIETIEKGSEKAAKEAACELLTGLDWDKAAETISIQMEEFEE